MASGLSRLAPIVAIAVTAGLAAPPDTRRLVEMDREATRLLGRATDAASAGRRSESSRLLKEAARRIDTLAGVTTLAPELRRELHDAASRLREQARRPPRTLSLEPCLRVLQRLGAVLEAGTPSNNLPFQGSYSR